MEVVDNKGANLQEQWRVTSGEWLATRQEIPSTRHCMGKSAQAIDKKDVAVAPLRKRVRKYLKTRGIEEEQRFD